MLRLRSLFVLVLLLVLAPLGGSQTARKKDKGTKYAVLVACSGYLADFHELPGTIEEMKEFRQVLLDSGWQAKNICSSTARIPDEPEPNWAFAS